jgi:putative effector of murein hydrolase
MSSSGRSATVAEPWIPVTVAAYGLALLLHRRTRSPLLNPTLLTIAALGALLLAADVPYEDYAGATSPLSAFLAPAIAALAVPLHRERATLRRFARPLVLGVLAGAVTAAAVGYLAALALHLAPAWSLALTARSATSPISIALAGELHGAAALSAVVSILAGVVGATVGPRWLDAVQVRHPLARGLAHGVASHGIGTARMVEESRLAGATAAVGMALGGVLFAFGLPLLWP